jgi:hypothetical protein
MKWPLAEGIDLAGGEIKSLDAQRQTATAEEILRRLQHQPGQILADEVGMGKTFVALAVAVSVLEATDYASPVVVMVPPSVRAKWPREWEVFRTKCLHSGREVRATPTTIRRGSEFLKLLDDVPGVRHDIIFLAHGALTSTLTDPLIRFAIVRHALKRPSLRAQRIAFPRYAASVLRTSRLTRDLTTQLLGAPSHRWKKLCANAGWDLSDDPLPRAVVEALPQVDLSEVVEALRDLPLRSGLRLQQRLRRVREALSSTIPGVWQECLQRSEVHSPLLILDEAHHAKNPRTALASLFATEAAADDAEHLGGALAQVFDRMLFLTATPFQLGHQELIAVLRRFDAIRWEGLSRESYATALEELEAALDVAHTAAIRLERSWGRISRKALAAAPTKWWLEQRTSAGPLRITAQLYNDVRGKNQVAASLLGRLVIRHVREDRDARREVWTGAARMVDDVGKSPGRGIEVSDEALLPFLLAARTQALLAMQAREGRDAARAYFAEGLASSFEAYARTRRKRGPAIDGADREPADAGDATITWYLKRIDRALPESDEQAWAGHPKIAATVRRAVDLWAADEKVLVFCFYIQTGRALRSHVSRAVHDRLVELAARKLGCASDDEAYIEAEIERIQARLSDADAPAARTARALLRDAFRHARLGPELSASAEEVVMPFLRTPSFLIRRFDLSATDRAEAFAAAMESTDSSGLTVRARLDQFAGYLKTRVPAEQEAILDALHAMPTRRIGADAAYDMEDVSTGAARDSILPNVRLANGEVSPATRERLMHGFNTPFFPEILISSAVMGEGVDLHKSCRHVIHHDLDWNPSTIEQRTGRVDRLESKAELTGKPVVVNEPYMEGTQDEKQFRVMKDRERWFNVVMGERLELDEASTDRLEKRLEFPGEAAEALAMKLAVFDTTRGGAQTISAR